MFLQAALTQEIDRFMRRSSPSFGLRVTFSISLLGLIWGCQEKSLKFGRFTPGQTETQQPQPPDAEISNPPSSSPQVEHRLGLRDFGQINETFSRLTGVASHGSIYPISTVYRRESMSLPGSNEITNFKGPHQVAITKLAAEYCHAMFEMTGNTRRNQILQGIDLQKDDHTEALAERLIEILWPDGLSFLPYAEAKQEVTALIKELRESPDSVEPLNTIKAACTSVLASLASQAL